LKSWIEISEERLKGNFRAVAEAVGVGTEVLAVVKANAYGHGAEVCSTALAGAGAKWLGVADATEAVRVRQALDAAGFVETKILAMCGLMPEDVEAIETYRLTPVVWTREQVGWLRGRVGMRVHIEVDTGMGRQGARPGVELDALLEAIAMAGLGLDGVMTHFSSAEVAGCERTREQERQFEAAVAQVRARGLRPGWVHAGSSSSVDNPLPADSWLAELAKSAGARAMARSGIALYGYCLPIEGPGGSMVEGKVRGALRPVMTWKTRVLDVRAMVAGDGVGYNSTFVAPGPMRLAVLPVGYSDGLRRELSSTNEKAGGWVMIGGRGGSMRRAAIVGRISMNLTMVDVTEIDGVRVGDEVVLLGDGVTADDHARIAGTISYEILCGVRGEFISSRRPELG
jgi:alanine racemase